MLGPTSICAINLPRVNKRLFTCLRLSVLQVKPPSIQMANKALAEAKPSDREQKRLKAGSKIHSWDRFFAVILSVDT